MLKDVKAVLFDVDGTLLNTEEFIYQAFEHALGNHKYEVPEREKMKKHMGQPLRDMYKLLTDSYEHADSLIKMHAEFQNQNPHLSDLFPGTLETLRTLRERGYKLAAVTTRFRASAVLTLKHTGIYDLFDAVVCGDDAPTFKPDPAPLLQALKTLGATPEQAIMIGDSFIDIQAGKNAGTRTIRALYGFNHENLHEPEPDHFVEDIRDILKIP